MFIVSRTVVLSFVTVALAAAPLGCTSATDADGDLAATANLSTSNDDLVAALDLSPAQASQLATLADGTLGDNHAGPNIDQMVAVLTRVLDLSEGQVKKLRAFLQAQEDAYHRAHP
jgi:hypothetical protein